MPYGTLDLRLAKSASRYYYLQEDITFSFRENPPGVKTNTFYDMTSWDSSPYKEGNLREKNGSNDLFVLNYRILFPKNYNPDFSPGYPIIFMLHGWGETGNCWERDCYWDDTGYNPNTNTPPAPTSPTLALLNNDRNLYLGGSQHLTAVNQAGSLLPDNPSLSPKAFPGFVLFPQSLNGWLQTAPVEDAIKLLRLIIKKYNIDENRVYIHGLSNGGAGVNNAVKRAPWLFASVLTMSAVGDGGIVSQNRIGEAAKIPYWIFQGGQDTNPTPGKTYNFVRSLRDNGAVVRYYLYPTLGHATWNTAFRETDFYSWNLQQRKYNPHVSYGNPVICKTTNTGVTISFSNGFLAYQWEKDGQIISGASSSEYIATTNGTYRGRFSRKSTHPTSDAEWEPWSDPIVVTEVNPLKPTIEVSGTTHLRGPGLANTNVNNTVTLTSSQTAELYEWFKNDQLINFANTDVDDTLKVATFTSASTSSNGTYTLRIKDSYCPSPVSDPVYLFFNNSAPQNIALNATSADLKGVSSASTVYLTWNDILTNETGYEVWRRKEGTTTFIFAGRTPANAISFLDSSLEPATTYEYKLRAINNTGRSNYVPSDDLNINYKISTSGDQKAPEAPQNLAITGNTINTITLKWDPAADDAGIKEYSIEYGNAQISTASSNTTFTLSNLKPNSFYPIKIRAIDFSGKKSQPSNQVLGNTYVTSLIYKHSTGTWSSLDEPTMVNSWSNPEFTGTINNFLLTPRTQEDYFNFQFTGYLNITTSGTYTFRITSDDGSRLILDGKIIADNDGKHGNVTKTSEPIQLNAGFHTIEVQYFDYNGGQTLTVQYMGPGIGNGSNFVNIPDAALKSGTYTPPTPPTAPLNLTAQTLGMQKVNLTWQFIDDANTDYEIYRSTAPNDPFIIVGRSTTPNFIDSVGLVPGKTYVYRAKTVNANGSSAFSNNASATTTADNIAPSIPGTPTLLSKTNTGISFNWSPSSDNIGISGYEILQNGQVLEMVTVTAYTALGLSTNQTYIYSVRAVDLSGNRSVVSEALSYYNGFDVLYYSKGSGNLNEISTWNTSPDGSGTSPLNFTDMGQQFIIANRTTTGIGNTWTVSGERSKVVVPTGVTLTVDHICTCKIELQGSLILDTETLPELISISPSSTIHFNQATHVPKNTYGNIILKNSAKTFDADTTIIRGNITIDGSALVSSGGNNATLKIDKDFIISGAIDNSSEPNVGIHFTENATHTIQSKEDVALFKLSTGKNAIVTLNSEKTINLITGSLHGGGLQLNNGSSLVLGKNHLQIIGAGVINALPGTGRISILQGDIAINSTSPEASNLFFDLNNHQVKYFEINVAGSAIVKENLDVIQGIKVKRGLLNANGRVTLLANDKGTATIYPIENGEIVGDVQAQLYYGGSGKVYKYISTPVKQLSVATLQQSIPVTGNFSGSSTGSGLNSDPSMFQFSSTGEAIPFPATGTSNNEVLEVGKGYSVLLYNGNSPTTIKLTGTLNQHNVSFNLSTTSSSNPTDGWNLIGNPYASTIEWNNEGWSKTGISNIIVKQVHSIVDGTNITQYQYFDPLLGTIAIHPGEAFWVRTTNANALLTITENAKTTNTENTYPSDIANLYYMAITLQQQSKRDKAYLILSTEGTDQFDALLDAAKRKNTGIFNISTSIDKLNMLAVNHVNANQCAKTIYLNIDNVTPGSYSLQFSNIQKLLNIWKIKLHDAFTNTVTTISQNPYNFSVTDNPNSYGVNRFYLTLEKVSVDLSNSIVEANDACSPGPGKITISNVREGVTYTAITTRGKRYSSVASGLSANVIIEIPYNELTVGNNIVRVEAGFGGCEAYPLRSDLNINVLPGVDVTTTSEVSVCTGSDVTLTASGAPDGGYYKWFNSSEEEIPNANTATFTISSIPADALYYVSSVATYGCESERKPIQVYASSVTFPVIFFENDTLKVEGDAHYQWQLNNQPIEGADTYYFVPETPGEYHVIASNGGCSVASEVYPFNLVSNEPIDENFNISVFPIPAKGTSITLQVITNYALPLDIQVLSLTGATMYKKSLAPSHLTNSIILEFPQVLADGIYILRIGQGKKEMKKKILIKN